MKFLSTVLLDSTFNGNMITEKNKVKKRTPAVFIPSHDKSVTEKEDIKIKAFGTFTRSFNGSGRINIHSANRLGLC